MVGFPDFNIHFGKGLEKKNFRKNFSKIFAHKTPPLWCGRKLKIFEFFRNFLKVLGHVQSHKNGIPANFLVPKTIFKRDIPIFSKVRFLLHL